MSTSHDDYRRSLLRFAQRVPELLGRHGSTTPAAIEVSRLDLAGQLGGQQFTIAAIGRMKAGKSTLLNALVGRPLAPVGVEETTATINWFCHGTEAKAEHFEIHWKDPGRAVEHRPTSAITGLLGRSEEAALIAHIRFFCDSAFLQGVQLIDTPGLMSTIDSHETATVDFVTRQDAERADATILVIPTVITQAEQKILLDYADRTRLPGQAAYNTIAVLQKWEWQDGPDPAQAAEALAADFQRRLESHVSEVLPVSGLLAIMSREVPVDAFDRLSFLAMQTSSSDLKALLGRAERFSLERSGVPLGAAERRKLFEEIHHALLGASSDKAAGTYEMIKFALGLAQRRQIATGERLKEEVWAASNLDRLQEVLDRRFFTISGLIQAGSVLKKALDPCRESLFRLRDGLDRRRELVVQGQATRATLARRLAETEELRPMLAYLDASLPLLNEQIAPIDATLRELDELVHAAEEDFKLLMTDIECLDILRKRPSMLSPDQVSQARRLFAQYGMERHVRLGVDASTTIPQQIGIAAGLHHVFANLGCESRVTKHAVDRLDRILNELEQQE